MTGFLETASTVERFLVTRILLEIVGNIVFEVGRFVGGIRYRVGLIRPIPRRYRSANWDHGGEDFSL